MAAFDPATLDRWRALAIVDRDGSTVGTINEFYLDRETGYPTWALISTGLFGTTQTFVPLVHATEISDGLQVPYEKRHIKDSPRVDPHDELSPDEEATLFAHYGVDYHPLVEPPLADDADRGSIQGPGPVEGPGPVPAGAGLTGSPTPVDTEPESAEAPGPVETEPWQGESPGPMGTESGSAEAPGPVHTESGSGDAAGPVPADPGSIDTQPGSAAAGSPEAVPDEPRTADPGDRPRSDTAVTTDPDPGDRPGSDPAATTGPDPDPALDWPAAADPDPGSSHAPVPDPDTGSSHDAPHDPDIGRTAPVAQGLPGSTAASPSGSGAATVDKDAEPFEPPVEEPHRLPAEASWAPGAARSFEKQEPVDRPAGASDRWREAKLAAERDRIARAAAARPEERSPLERARRRLERLVGGGQEHDDPEDISPTDREAAERARRARLGLDDGDDRRRR
jgi:PRC-barrel domain